MNRKNEKEKQIERKLKRLKEESDKEIAAKKLIQEGEKLRIQGKKIRQKGNEKKVKGLKILIEIEAEKARLEKEINKEIQTLYYKDEISLN